MNRQRTVMPWCSISRGFVAVVCCWLGAPAGGDAFTPQQLEHFEKKVRPVLAEHCYKCHSADAKKLKASLRLDSRAGVLAGGDSGAGIVPGRPDESRLIEAVSYTNVDLEMPPTGKLPDAVIADLRRWVEMGAPWPAEAAPGAVNGEERFDIERLKREHWAWRPVDPNGVAPPTVRDASWSADPIDAFILAKVEAAGLAPAPQADRRTLVRRLYFDLVGLPPPPEAVEAFVNDSSADAYEKVVDRLLDSPQFGERWARHWLDLVRYAESRGHEFDHDVPNAHEYRDYVIRAFNADVPYDRFVIEHLAGDLLEQPRLNPDEGFNESVLGTGFWFLGEWIHSPVDIRKDEAERYENMIDVMSKTFLGMTVACARCHDHKFDAISTEDYYALQGYLQSSTYRQARFETFTSDAAAAEALAAVQERAQRELRPAMREALRPGIGQTAAYLLAARDVIAAGPVKTEPADAGDIVFDDFEDGDYEGWTARGEAFYDAPATVESTRDYLRDVKAQGQRFVHSHHRMPGVNGPATDRLTGTLTSRPFAIDRDYIHMLVCGGAHKDKTCVQVIVDGEVVASVLGANDTHFRPHVIDVRRFRGQGKQAVIRLVDDHTGSWGHIGVDHIVFSDRPGDGGDAGADADAPGWRARADAVAETKGLDGGRLSRWVAAVRSAKTHAGNPLHAFAVVADDGQASSADRLPQRLGALAEQAKAHAQRAAEAVAKTDIVIDYADSQPWQWLQDGYAFGPRPRRAGDLQLSDDPAKPVSGVARRGVAAFDPAWEGLKLADGYGNDPGRLGGWVRSGRTLRTPTFEVKDGRLWYLVRGAAHIHAVVDSHRLIAGPLHGEIAKEHNGKPGEFQWVGHTNLQRYIGHRIHIEFAPKDGTDFAVAMVAQGERPGDVLESSDAVVMAELLSARAESLEELASAYEATMAKAFGESDGESAAFGSMATVEDWLARHVDLFLSDGSDQAKALAEAAGPIVRERQRVIEAIRRASRVAPAMLEGDAEDEYVFIRGNHRNRGEVVRRRNLAALGGLAESPPEHGSGRLALARQIADPANPLTSRVMVNRIWHHLFGVGIVPSVDNFGVLGQPPTHPQLLDHLADRFVKEGWSIKRMIRALVMTRTYRMASRHADAAVEAKAASSDPGNALLSRMRVRRLEAEAIRDAILACSGRLDEKMFGRSVPVHLTPFMEGRGRPGSGPVDGAGRRSIYIGVRRNFLPPMMMAFDMPTPYTTVGRRSASNVPAQALILMNDPFVAEQAKQWAQRVLAEPDASPQQRIATLYLTAFSRPPSEAETHEALDFLRRQGSAYGLDEARAITDIRPWADLCHVLFNVKEFIFVN